MLVGEGFAALEQLVSRLCDRIDLETPALIEGVSGVALAPAPSSQRPSHHAPDPPPPAWDLLDIERYRSLWRASHGYFSLNMTASRGCPFRCNWCAKPIWGNRYLQRTPGEVAAEMTDLKRRFAPDHIWFADDIFGFRADWVSEFAEAVHKMDGAVPFTIQTRADLVTGRMSAALREAGCREAWLGAESGSQRILDAMNKGTSVAEIHAARARLASAGIRVGFFIQLGYLGEELSDILATRQLIETAQPDDVGVSVSYPLPGTRFYELVKDQLRRDSHWRESDDLAMMFQGTYTSAFYRTVRDLLHAQVTLRGGSRTPQTIMGLLTERTLRHRWARLLACERRFRTPPVAVAHALAQPMSSPT